MREEETASKDLDLEEEKGSKDLEKLDKEDEFAATALMGQAVLGFDPKQLKRSEFSLKRLEFSKSLEKLTVSLGG